ncbi:MAG: decarboxylase [Candidatus Thiodiazotropha sp. (ex Lucinoma borealis)]|nr:decarboxylase [Candidatus Thiodiazotropha sp. (ex Lucinoma borealis)]MCU7868288.1 decarboxylase [Candidatus Thiodiazotropha sp. (ex Lucinoma borealis)]
MPFFVFKISADNKIEYIDEEEKYRPAREKVKKLRAAHNVDDGTTYRMIFANSIGQGEILLSPTESDNRIIGDD